MVCASGHLHHAVVLEEKEPSGSEGEGRDGWRDGGMGGGGGGC